MLTGFVVGRGEGMRCGLCDIARGVGWRGAAVDTPTLTALDGGRSDGGRVEGRVSPAWQSVMRRIACKSVGIFSNKVWNVD